MKKQVSYKIVSLAFGVLVICFAVGFYIFAWTEPTTTPPGGNVPAPLNVSNIGQPKMGGLALNTGVDGIISSDGAQNGLLVYEGNVGIGTVSPQNRLDIEGSMAVGTTYSGNNTAPANSVIIEGSVSIGTTSPSSGTGGQLKLDVEGNVGAAMYCDQDGNNCKPMTQIGGALPTCSNGDYLRFDNTTSAWICSGTGPCTSNCSCAADTCIGMTCSNGCGGTCPGTKVCPTTCPGGPTTTCTLCVAGTCAFGDCKCGDQSGENWTGSLCCVEGVGACTTGTCAFGDCKCGDQSNERWTGTKCCIRGPTICTTGTCAWGDCRCGDQSGENWTGTQCCVSSATICTTGTCAWGDCECGDQSNERWTGTKCCLIGPTACAAGNRASCVAGGGYWTGTVCCI